MACRVKVNQHGYLAFRFYWHGRQFWQGTGWPDTEKNRKKAEGKAVEITEELKAGTFNYLKWFPRGNKAHEFKAHTAQLEPKTITVGNYYREWIERRKPPFVRPGLHYDYTRQFRRYILPKFENTSIIEVTLPVLESFRLYLSHEWALP